ncbi:osm1 [Symbiodinium pilosum]|uniref:Osm1 protein n=1 Tax=Symbiodinium pilosum TaxID=2952 RepID=A0A812KSN6_SYMPI|nr:osm1 [Symbiodinium pilosum]
MVETREEGDIQDADLEMDWMQLDLQGATSSLPDEGQQMPAMEGIDKKTMGCFPSIEQAPATTIARNLRAARSDGCDAPGILCAGAMADSNAGRDVQKHLNKFDLGLNVPRETLNFPVGNGAVPIELPWIRPTSWVAFLIEKYPKLLCGTARNAEAELDTFWSLYRKVHPQHAAFKGNEDASVIAQLTASSEDMRICTCHQMFLFPS